MRDWGGVWYDWRVGEVVDWRGVGKRVDWGGVKLAIINGLRTRKHILTPPLPSPPFKPSRAAVQGS